MRQIKWIDMSKFANKVVLNLLNAIPRSRNIWPPHASDFSLKKTPWTVPNTNDLSLCAHYVAFVRLDLISASVQSKWHAIVNGAHNERGERKTNHLHTMYPIRKQVCRGNWQWQQQQHQFRVNSMNALLCDVYVYALTHSANFALLMSRVLSMSASILLTLPHALETRTHSGSLVWFSAVFRRIFFFVRLLVDKLSWINGRINT